MEKQLSPEVGIEAYCASLKNSMYFSMPGSVVAYYPGTATEASPAKPPTADVQPMTNDVRIDLDTGQPVFEPWSVVKGVPVAWPTFCGGTFTVTGFLQPSDQVLLTAFDLDPNPWRAQGRSSNPTNPQDFRRHGGDYWRAIPCDLTVPVAGAPTSPGLVIGNVGGQALITIKPGSIELGSSGGDAVALASVVDKFIQAVMGWAPVANDGGAALKAKLSMAGFSLTSKSGSTLVACQ